MQLPVATPKPESRPKMPMNLGSLLGADKSSTGTGSDKAVKPIEVPPPDQLGHSTISFPSASADSMTLTVDAIDPLTTVDRRYGETTVLPVPSAVGRKKRPPLVNAEAR